MNFSYFGLGSVHCHLQGCWDKIVKLSSKQYMDVKAGLAVYIYIKIHVLSYFIKRITLGLLHSVQISNLIFFLPSKFLLGFLRRFFTFFFDNPLSSTSCSIVFGRVSSSRFSRLRSSSSGLHKKWRVIIYLKFRSLKIAHNCFLL